MANGKTGIELKTARVFRVLDEANLEASYSRMATEISSVEALRGIEKTLPALDRDKTKFATLDGRAVALFEDDGSPFRGKICEHRFENAIRLTGSAFRHGFVSALPARQVDIRDGEFIDGATKVPIERNADRNVVQLPGPVTQLFDLDLPFSLQASIVTELWKASDHLRRQTIDALKASIVERIATSLHRRSREPDIAIQAAIALDILEGNRSPFTGERRASLALEDHRTLRLNLPTHDIHLKLADVGLIPIDLFERPSPASLETFKTNVTKENLTLTGLETVFRMRHSARLKDTQSTNLLRTFFHDFQPLKTWKRGNMSFSLFELEEGCVVWERDHGSGEFFLTTWTGSAREGDVRTGRFVEFPDLVARDQIRYAHARILRFADASLFRTESGAKAFVETFENTRKIRTGFLRPRSSFTQTKPFEDRRAATFEGRRVFICEDDLSPVPATEEIDLSLALRMPGAGNRIALPLKEIGNVGIDDEGTLVLPMMAMLAPEAMVGLVAICGNLAFSVDDPLDVRMATLFHATSPSASFDTISTSQCELLTRHLKATMRVLLRKDRKNDTLSREIVSARKFRPRVNGLVDVENSLEALIGLREG